MPRTTVERLETLLDAMETLSEQEDMLSKEGRWDDLVAVIDRMAALSENLAELASAEGAQNLVTSAHKARARRILDREEVSLQRLEEGAKQMGEQLTDANKARSRVARMKPVYGRNPFQTRQSSEGSGLNERG